MHTNDTKLSLKNHYRHQSRGSCLIKIEELLLYTKATHKIASQCQYLFLLMPMQKAYEDPWVLYKAYFSLM